jgi:fused signal recognition particle receptor
LHTKFNLMEELRKVRRVIERRDPTAPHEVLLVLDATTGQNALIQAKAFTEAVDVTAIALTKLDGTSKGGIVFAISDELGLPVRFVGTGEGEDDLNPFDPRAFVDALFD